MAWPFPFVVAPNKDSGFVAVPQVAAAPTNFDTTTAYWVMGINLANNGDSAVNVALMDGSGALIIPHVYLAARAGFPLEWPFMPVVGLQWVATGPVTGKVWGYA